MDLFKLQNGSDIRGVAIEGVPGEAVNLTPAVVSKIARAFAKWLEQNTGKKELIISIGRDSRISGESLVEAVINGISNKYTTVYNFGMASTPAMYMSTINSEINAHGAIMVTASHLPYNRNGLKFFTRHGGLDSNDITEILSMAENIDYIEEEKGEVKEYDFISKYASDLVNKIRRETNSQKPFTGVKIIVDAGNGAGGFFVDKVLQPLGAETDGSQYLEPDGMFPNHEPNPENREAIASIKEAVVANDADLGIIFDTDVDRAAIVDKNGNAINRNDLIALVSAIVLEEHPNTTIVTDSVTSVGLRKFIEGLGGKHHRFKRGYKNVINEAIRLNKEGVETHLAIETSGHCAFKENYFLDDGAYLVTKVLIKFAIMRSKGKDISELISGLERPVSSKELRGRIATSDFRDFGYNLLEDFKNYINKVEGWSLEIPNYEGVRVNCKLEDGWCLMRLSLHDPVIVINIESNKCDGVNIIEEKLNDFLIQYKDISF